MAGTNSIKKTMKCNAMGGALLLLFIGLGADAQFTLGPQNCASVTKSAAGSCTISLKCGAFDLSTTEFAFDCVVGATAARHSFGFGGFDPTEVFDTEVKCDRCMRSMQAAAPPAAPPPPSYIPT